MPYFYLNNDGISNKIFRRAMIFQSVNTDWKIVALSNKIVEVKMAYGFYLVGIYLEEVSKNKIYIIYGLFRQK